MLFVDDAKLTKLADIVVGSLALSFEYNRQGAPVLISEHEGQKGVLQLRNECFTRHGSGQSTLMSFGMPVVRFDPQSAVAGENGINNGVLMVTPGGVGVFEQMGPFRSTSGYLTLISGERTHFYWDQDTPAFAEWEIGYMRGQEFAVVAKIDARRPPENL